VPELSLGVLLLLVVAAFAAGWLDAVGGGGGLIQLPILLLALPISATASALGTNKLASSFGTGAAAVTYARKFPPNYQVLGIAMAAAFVGSAVGARFANLVSPELFQPIIFVLLLLVWLLNWFNFKPAVTELGRGHFGFPLFALLIGFYDGLIGPGTGAFLLTGLVFWQGMNFLEASANAKFINFATNIAAILVFGLAGQIYWALGGIMAVFNIVGGQLGARFAIARGGDFVRKVLLLVVALLLLRLGFQIWG
jgi:uncharacterized protein